MTRESEATRISRKVRAIANPLIFKKLKYRMDMVCASTIASAQKFAQSCANLQSKLGFTIAEHRPASLLGAD